MNQKSLESVDWSGIPEPFDDGSARHLNGRPMPDMALPSTDGGQVNPGRLKGWSVLFFYPMTGRPDVPLPSGWDKIPGARGCTPQACSFRDLSAELADAGVAAVHGVSTQTTEYQREAAGRLRLPFTLLSDSDLRLTVALELPTMEVLGSVLIRRLTLVLCEQRIMKVFFPVFPPDRNASDVLGFMKRSGRT